MRRQIIILFCLLCLALPVFGQDWPETFVGEAHQMYLENSFSPWGLSEPTGKRFYFGTLLFGECDGVEVAELNLTISAYRWCSDSQCYYYRPIPIQLWYRLNLDSETGSYLIQGCGNWGCNAIVLTMATDFDFGVMKMGVLDHMSGTTFVWDDTYPWYTYVIAPKTAIKAPMYRRSGERRQPNAESN